MASIDINFLLLLVELILLIPTLLLLVLGRKEERGRRQLLGEISKTARMVSRQEYFNHVQSSMQGAKESIKGAITGSSPRTHEEEELVRRISEQVKGARGRNVSVKYLIPRLPDRITVAAAYKDAGGDIRFHPALIINDLRFVVVDGKNTVIGLPSHVGGNEPTREGYYIPSEGLATIFSQQFEAKWAQATLYEDYLRDVIAEARSHSPSISTELLSVQLKIPESEVKRFLSKQIDDGSSSTLLNSSS